MTKIAKLLTAPVLALCLSAPVLAAGPAGAATTDAYTFTNPDGTLNATGTGDGNQISVTPDGTNFTNWRLIRLGEPGTFNLANASSGKCVYASQPAVQQSCGKDGQQWHFRPVDGKPDTFGIVRRDDTSGAEYCMDNRGGLHLWGILAQPNPCNGSAGQQWKVPASKAAEARSLALDYYADLCSRKTSTCSWTQKSEGPPEALPRVKASSVWYNDTADKVSQVFTTVYHSGWAQSFSASVGTSFGVSVPFQAMVSAQLTSGVTYTSDSTTINGVVVTVPAKNYGWVDFAAVGKKVTGTWTFDTDNQPWTADATVTVPVVDSPAGSTMYIAHTSADVPGSTTTPAPAPAPAVQTFATTTSAKLDLPAGTHLTATANGAEITDATGSPVMRMQPGSVTDTRGIKHAYKLAVDGNTLTQTVEGAPGPTVDGTEAPSAIIVGPGAFPAGTARAGASAATKATGMQLTRDDSGDACARAQGHTCSDAEKKAYDEKLKKAAAWDKCVAQWTVGTAITGAVAGAPAAGVGALAGGVLGMIGGASAGMVVCSF
ncbi:RICIN domain-containing protein [Kitasatospora purpeofusca]|uniref:RICIN domain-containing protein n=1 Tax=Kitasatospora purpeofusca TaxID=67352 RepID=UPI00224FC257|nr:RICIN domain-containing protein [Kitasatospora purpeofusca]MCX4755721.1 ricin-type beta-trefoil lectin domain protein [Kitasatospora purpeofusca]WSR36417.1 ricin-type beta-trefoil lectin domain protein [Kitasatospora purpeofusca]WSR44703.1 ricin-type beta-trefoil lectin domain protein [Kitasatospora purpeofusca]